jgi:type I restriction enzyme S subunit
MVLLGDVCKTSAGGTPLKSRKEYYKDGKIPWLMSGEVCKKDIFTSVNHITNAGVENSSAKIFPVNTTLVAMYGATAGQVGILRFPATTNQAVCGILPNDNYLPEFIYYYFTYYKEILLLEASGVAQPNLSQIKIKNVPFPKISIQLQHKIVAKLDAIFAEIDRATAAAEANAENSCDLYSSAVNLIFERLTNRHIKLSSCSAIGYGYTSKSSIKFTGPQYLRITDIQDDRVDWLLVPRIEEKISEVKKFLLKDGDIVFARTGATTGKSYLIKEPPFSVFASYLIRVDPDRNSIEPEYLRHFFRSGNYWTEINAGISGAAQGGFNASKLGEMMFPLPVISIQKQLVKQLDEIEHLSLVLKKSQENKVKELNCLKQSILRQAFNGELVKD